MLVNTRVRPHGFTLLELILVSGLSGLILTIWIGSLSQQMVGLDNRLQTSRKTQQFHHLGFWLSQELERARDSGEYAWQWQEDCLLYSDEGGIRLHEGRLQWRGGNRLCHQSRWTSLSDPADYEITGFRVTQSSHAHGNGQLWLSALIEGEALEWEYRFNGQLHFIP